MNTIDLGIIDLGFREDANAVSSIEAIIEYAVEAENLGYSKFWLAEHHYYHIKNHPYTNPDILMTLIAGMTEKIKIGSAGTSINLYSPYHTVCNYKLLNNLYYDRISLGFSKGLPDSTQIASFVNPELSLETNFSFFNKNMEAICDLLENEEKNLEEKQLLIPPYKGLKPELWYLSTSFRNFPDAIRLKLNYCISTFHNASLDLSNLPFTKEEIHTFKEAFFAVNGFFPKVVFAIAVVLKDTLEEAEKAVNLIQQQTKEKGSEAFLLFPATMEVLEQKLTQWQEELGVHEFVIYDVAPTNAEKLKNLQLISEKFNLMNLVG